MGIGDTGTQTFVVIPDNAASSYDVTIDLRDVRMWERTHPRNTLRKFAENPSADDIYSLVYTAIKRQRLWDPESQGELPPLGEWINDVRVLPKADPGGGVTLDRTELVEVIERALAVPDSSSVVIADMVMDFLEELRTRQPDPTQRVR